MKFYAYVLFSRKFNRFYKGYCQDLELRLIQHNRGETFSTKPFIPWEVVYFETFNTREEAISREKYFKTAAGRKFLRKVISL